MGFQIPVNGVFQANCHDGLVSLCTGIPILESEAQLVNKTLLLYFYTLRFTSTKNPAGLLFNSTVGKGRFV